MKIVSKTANFSFPFIYLKLLFEILCILSVHPLPSSVFTPTVAAVAVAETKRLHPCLTMFDRLG